MYFKVKGSQANCFHFPLYIRLLITNQKFAHYIFGKWV